jgi:HJR/Mrr/RecB family endonuclease
MKPWTPQEDDLLRELALSGANIATIASQVKRSQSAVRNRAIKLSILVTRVRELGLKVKNTKA